MCPRLRPHRGRASFANSQNFREVGLHQCPSERNGERVPVRSLHVLSHVPSHPQTAAKVRGFSLTASGFTAETDWLLEGSGFELSVPRKRASSRIATSSHTPRSRRAPPRRVPTGTCMRHETVQARRFFGDMKKSTDPVAAAAENRVHERTSAPCSPGIHRRQLRRYQHGEQFCRAPRRRQTRRSSEPPPLLYG
jgi:hypothetical protein